MSRMYPKTVEVARWIREAKVEAIMSTSVMLLVTFAGYFIARNIIVEWPLLYELIIITSGIGIWANLYILRALHKISFLVNDKETTHMVQAWFALEVLAMIIFIAMMHISRPSVDELIWIWIAKIVAATFLKKSYERIAARTGTKMFTAVGDFYYLSALLATVSVGFAMILIALLLQLIAFSHLPKSLPSQPTVR
jgi:uncharacterized membrane protein